MSTGLDLINRAARAARIQAASEQFSAGDANDALTIANGMLDSWNAQRLMIFTIQRQTFALNSGQQTYQMGSGAPDFNVPRPPRIDRYGVITLANPAQPLELPLDNYTYEQWAQIPVKNIAGALPTVIYDDAQFPNRNLNFWPVPNVTTLEVALYTWTALTSLVLTNTYAYPPGYYEALVYNLAVRMAVEWPGKLTPELDALALSSLKTVKSINSTIVDLKCDPALNNPKSMAYNWLSDTPVSK